MENVIYNVDHFINKFRAIPEEMWLIRSQGEKELIGNMPHCALGWCRNYSGYYGCALEFHDETSPENEDGALAKLFRDAGIFSYGNSQGVAWVNNGDHPSYQQPTPKQRILQALYDIKAMQDKPKEEQPRVIYKTVEVDRKVKKLTTTTFLN